MILKKLRGLAKRTAWALTPSPVDAYGERTIVYLPRFDESQADDFLLDLAYNAIARARQLKLDSVVARQHAGATDHPNLWPGEHYRLLAAIVDVLAPRRIVEIGTYQGLSALSMLTTLPPGSELVTFDVVPWHQIDHCCLRPTDFEGGKLRQVIADLSEASTFNIHADTLKAAQVIFIDAPKNGIFEPRLVDLLLKSGDIRDKLVVFDDIHNWNMLALWRGISFPKLDLTSFGHWTGSGLVHWRPV